MLRLVLDTNVVLDLFHFADPVAHPILAAMEGGLVRCFADDATLEELCRVVAYPEFGLTPAAGSCLVGRYRQLTSLVVPDPAAEPKLPKCRDRDDQKFLQLAARSQADLLVSKDKALLRFRRRAGLGFDVVTPGEAGALLAALS